MPSDGSLYACQGQKTARNTYIALPMVTSYFKHLQHNHCKKIRQFKKNVRKIEAGEEEG
jgi:hypothetical protein